MSGGAPEPTTGRELIRAAARSRFGVLFLVLILTLVVPAVLPAPGRVTAILLSIGVTLALVSGLWAVSQTRRQGLFGLLLLAACIVLSVLDHTVEGEQSSLAAAASAALFLGYLAWATFVYVVGAKRVDANILFAAVCVYLLLGFLCGMLFYIIELASGDPLVVSTVSGNVEGARLSAEAVYYSFVTLTTLGYGDIAPVATASRVVAILEALLGQLYLVILVARLVALHIVHARSEAE